MPAPGVPAVVGSARLGNFRLGYMPAALAVTRRTRARILIGGVESRTRVSLGSETVHDVINDAPNTCDLTVLQTAPSGGQDLRIYVNSDTPVLLFNGELQTNDTSYQELTDAEYRMYPCKAIDDTARVNRRRPFGTWTDVSATTVALELVAAFAPWVSTTFVQAGLPTITVTFDGTEGFNGCFRLIAKLIGGYFYYEDGALHLFQVEAAGAPDPLIDGSFENDPPIRVTIDRAQLRTRAFGKGHAEPVLVDVLAGDTILPIDNASMFNLSGGQAIASTTPDSSASERLSYTGVILAGPGTIAGPGAAPSVAPSLTAADGAGLSAGTYKYAYTDVTAAGESLPSPLGSIVLGGSLTDPTGPPTVGLSNAGAVTYPIIAGNTYKWAYTFSTAIGETLPSALITVGPVGAGGPYHAAVGIPLGPAGTTGRKIYRTVAGGAQLKLSGSVANNTALFYDDQTLDGSLGANAPTVNTAVKGLQMAISGVAIGGAGTTSRKIYRTVVNGSQLKLQQTVPNNTATVGVQDATADGSLGANVPVVDGSGLTQPFGQVNAGSTTIVTSGTGGLAVSGYVRSPSDDIIRYTGITGNSLTGIPASGPGSIVTTIFYEDQLVPVPALTGVTGLTKPLAKGSPVHVWVQRDDLAAQAELVALDAAQGRVSDGVVEGTPIVDERRGEGSLMALCDADLVRFSRPIVTIEYTIRDASLKTKSGKPLVVNVTSPPFSGTLTIQEVTITEIDMADGLPPKFSVKASSVNYSLEDLLRRMSAQLVD